MQELLELYLENPTEKDLAYHLFNEHFGRCQVVALELYTSDPEGCQISGETNHGLKNALEKTYQTQKNALEKL